MDTRLERQLHAITALLALIAVTRIIQVAPGALQAAPLSGLPGLAALFVVAGLAVGLAVFAAIQGLRAVTPARSGGGAEPAAED
jgi:hypothetical protein